MLVGSPSAVESSTMGLISPGAGNIISSSTALLTSIAILLITNECNCKSKKNVLQSYQIGLMSSQCYMRKL